MQNGFPDDDFDAADDSANEAAVEAAIEELVERQPALALIREFAGAAGRTSWFVRLGDVLGAEEKAAARAYLDGLGFVDAEAARLGSWEDAAAAATSLDWDSEGWAAEEGLRAALTFSALETLSEEEFEVVQHYTTSTVAPQIRAAADEMGRISDFHDQEVLTAAVGAGIQATHAAMLVLLAGEDNHPFTHRYKLFTLGRWPIGVAGLTLNIF